MMHCWLLTRYVEYVLFHFSSLGVEGDESPIAIGNYKSLASFDPPCWGELEIDK